MNLQKSNMTVLAQVVKQIPAKIIDSLAKKFKIQTWAFSPTSHVVTLLYEHLAHSLSLNDVCDSLQHHKGMLSQIRCCTPPTRNGLSYANRAGFKNKFYENLVKKRHSRQTRFDFSEKGGILTAKGNTNHH